MASFARLNDQRLVVSEYIIYILSSSQLHSSTRSDGAGRAAKLPRGLPRTLTQMHSAGTTRGIVGTRVWSGRLSLYGFVEPRPVDYALHPQITSIAPFQGCIEYDATFFCHSMLLISSRPLPLMGSPWTHSRHTVHHCLADHMKSSASAEAELWPDFLRPSSWKFASRRGDFVKHSLGRASRNLHGNVVHGKIPICACCFISVFALRRPCT